MIFYMLATFVALIWLWSCFHFYAARAQWSQTIRTRGTIFFSALSLIVSVVAYQVFKASEQLASTPTSFVEAGLADKKWTLEQLPLAAAVTTGRLTMLHDDLVWAASLNDKIRARILVDETASVETQWKNQNPTSLGQYAACREAAMQLSARATALQQGQKGWPKDEFPAVLEGCRLAS